MAADELKDTPGMSEEESAAATAQREAEIKATMDQVGAYEKKVEMMVGRVQKETSNVEREVENLKNLQRTIDKDPLLRLSNFSNQPLPKQALLAASLLSFIRGGGDALSIVTSGDPGTYALPAAAQLGFALVAISAYLFL